MKRLSSLLALVVATLTALALGAAQGSAARETASDEPSVHIVLLDGAPLAAYGGGVAGLAPTDPTVTGARRLDSRSAASRAYLAYLSAQQTDQLARIGTAIGRSVQAIHRYNAVLNGFALALSADEAQRVAALSGVARVVRDTNLELLTDVGPTWIGAEAVWSGSATGGTGTRGEDVLVGVVDTGINHDHPSFADPGPTDGFAYSSYAAPAGPGYRGACDPVTGAPFCNDKLVGVYDFTGTTPLDDNGHGSHTASTAAGNVLDAEIIAPMTLERRISGVAPHARLIAYKACVTAGAAGACPQSGTVASINQATLDGVDVINFSIGGGSRNPWTDVNALAFLNALRAGVFLAVSAGNDGPGAATVGSPADSPWVTAVGASTHNRLFKNSLTELSGGGSPPPPTLVGKGITVGYGPAPIVYAGDRGAPLCGTGPAEAAINPWGPDEFDGEIVVCDRGTYGRVQKGQFLKEAGAGGYVLANDELNGDSVVGDAHHLPAVHITYADGVTLKAWLAAGSGHTGRITGLVTDEAPTNGDLMGSFSSRGPNPSVPGVLKPDVTAPGVDILAAFNTPAGSVGAPPEYNSISGTSMSGPHTAGAAALVRALRPNWSPDEVRSALITTGFNSLPGEGSEVHGVLKEDSATPADPFDLGGGRVELRRAARAGLVLDVDPDTYAAADPTFGGDPTTLNLATLADDSCAGTCSWTREVKSSVSGSVTWTASGQSLGLTVTPASFTLASGASQTLTITADASGVGDGDWGFGRVVLDSSVGSVPDATLPVAIRAAGGEPAGPPRVTLHFHGNAALEGADHDSGHSGEGNCTGDGRTDLFLAACSGPYLLKSPNLSPSPAASWKGGAGDWALDGIDNGGDRTGFDPSWIWCLRADSAANPDEFECPETESPAQGETTLEGPMTIKWWADCGALCVLQTDWEIRLFADGVEVVDQDVSPGAAAVPGATQFEATVNVPNVTANHHFTLIVEPIFLIDQGLVFSIYYDSQGPCRAPGSGPCDSVVHMPVVAVVANREPVANDDSATVGREGSVDVDVLANDTDADGDELEVTAFTHGSYGTVTKNDNGTLKYTQSGGPTASDSFAYTVNDGRGGTDTATVSVTVTGPDLVVSDVTTARNGGNRTTVTATVENDGTSDAPATATEFVVDDSTVIGVAATPAIPAGESATVSVQWSTAGVSGEHELTVTADDAEAAAETNETNNAATLTVTVKGNKVQNGSFEQSSNGSSPDNWTSSGDTTYEQGGSDGERSASAGPTGSWQSDPVDVQAGVGYGFSVDVSGAAGTVTIEQLSAAGTVLASLPLPFAASPLGVFETVAGALTTVEGAVQVRVRLAGSLAGTATFDNVWLWEE
jgi:subtilisin family serine protease